MAGKKISVEFDVQEDLVKMLEYAAEKYKLGDKSKALRCLLDFAAMDGDWDVLFKQLRCVRCAPDGGWNQEKHEAEKDE